MIYGMNNQVITDIKQVGQRVIEFGTKREEPVLQYYQHQNETEKDLSVRDEQKINNVTLFNTIMVSNAWNL
jgi:hypothetical protein